MCLDLLPLLNMFAHLTHPVHSQQISNSVKVKRPSSESGKTDSRAQPVSSIHLIAEQTPAKEVLQ